MPARIALALCLLALAACGKKSDDEKAEPAAAKASGSGSTATTTTKKAATLTGKIAGAAWTLVSARAIPTADDDPTQPWMVSMVSEKFAAPCQESVFQADDKKRLEFQAKVDAPGETELGSDAKVQFIDESGSSAKKVAGKAATFTIDTSTATTIKGKLTAAGADDTTDAVTGAVSIIKCCATDDGLAYQACTAN